MAYISSTLFPKRIPLNGDYHLSCGATIYGVTPCDPSPYMSVTFEYKGDPSLKPSYCYETNHLDKLFSGQNLTRAKSMVLSKVLCS